MKTTQILLLVAGLVAGASYQALAQWMDVDVGTPGTDPANAGSWATNATAPGAFRVSGGGSDIYNNSDAFHYFYTIVSGSFDISVQCTNLTGPDTWTKAELMMRVPDPNGATWPNNPGGGDPQYDALTTRSAGQNEIRTQWRQTRGGSSGGIAPSPTIPPIYPNVWLRLTRIINPSGTYTVTSYRGTDGKTWTQLHTFDTGASGWAEFGADPLLVGVAVTAHSNPNTTLGIGDFRNLHLAPPGTPIFTLAGTVFGFTGYGLVLQNAITNIDTVKLDGTNITASVVTSNAPSGLAFLDYPGTTNRQVANAPHTVDVTFETADGKTNTLTGLTYTVPWFFTAPTNWVLPLSAIDTNQPGFTIRPWQSQHQYEPNAYRWAEEQILGLRGPNVADLAGATATKDANGDFVWPGVLDFSNGQTPGAFPNNFPLTAFGIGDGNYPAPAFADNSALEIFSYVYFPTSGIYQVYVESDDTFYITTSQNAMDRMGNYAMSLGGWQAPTDPSAAYHIAWVVDQPGVYPMRLLWENGNGGAGLELFAGYPQTDGTTNFILLNDDGVNYLSTTPSPIQCYRATASAIRKPYVKKANPVHDGQNVVFYQPIVIDLADGNGSLTVNSGTISLKVDGVAQTSLTVTKAGDTTHVVQNLGTNTWTQGPHTNLLTFLDNATPPNTYTYTWPFTVISVVPTNTPVVAVPASVMVATNTLDFTQPGFRVRSYQTVAYQPNRHGWTEEQIEGLRGPNLADQLLTNGPGFFSYNGVWDFANNGGATMEWNYNGSFTTFGINDPSGVFPFWDNCTLEIGAWLVFPAAGTYLMHVNSDDGWQVSCPFGTPFNKLGTVVGLRDAGSSTGGPNLGAMVGSGVQYFSFSIPAPGAYPFRLLWENGTGGLALEWSIYQFLPDGSVGKVPVNDPDQPYSIRAYQTLLSADAAGPYVTYANPAPDTQNAVFYQPIVVDLTDGGAKTVDATKVNLWVDGVPQTVGATKSGSVTHVVQQMDGLAWQPGFHTNLLTYTDNAGATYSNTWSFSVMNIRPFGIINIPLTNMVPTASIDHSKPGFLIRSYETAAAVPGNSSVWVEQQQMGLQGANLADQTQATNQFGSFAWTDMLDFGGNGAYGEWGYNAYIYGWNIGASTAAGGAALSSFGLVNNGGGQNTNYFSLDIGAWLEFPQAGTYIMHVNPDDGFRLTAPYGNPFNKVGTELTWRESTGGQGGASVGQVGGTYVALNIPAPGAYPFRLLWWNVTGGFGCEWSIYKFRPDGSVVKVLINDTNVPDAILAYQSSSLSTPFVKNISPVPTSAAGAATPVMALGSGMGQPDLALDLADGATAVRTNTLALTFNGIAQPLAITQSSSGLTHIVRPAGDPQFWPSGAYGPLTLTYQDSAGRTEATTWYVATAFWGTLTNAMPIAAFDTNKAGFKARVYQIDPLASANPSGSQPNIPNRVHVAEQILAGLWATNAAHLTNLTAAPYWHLAGTGPTNGTINFNIPGQAQAGDLQASGGYPDTLFPGIPGTITYPAINSNTNNSFAWEFQTYVEFPTNGIYTLGFNSDDGFRVTKGSAPPAHIGELVVNSPAALAGPKATVLNGGQTAARGFYLASYALTNPVTGYLVLAQGIGYGSTTNGEACVISNPSDLVGKIALIFRSVSACGYLQQVQNAADAGAIGVVLVQNRPANEGFLPQEPEVTPAVPIPAVEIEQADGLALLAAGAATNNTVVSVTLNPMDYTVNPPPDQSPLGQADWGKGSSDVLFPVVVQQAGVYPLRIVYWQGGGGANAEFFSYVGGTRVLINDLTKGGLRAFYATGAAQPMISQSYSSGNVTLIYTGTLQSSTDLETWSDVAGATSPWTVPANQPNLFFRARQ